MVSDDLGKGSLGSEEYLLYGRGPRYFQERMNDLDRVEGVHENRVTAYGYPENAAPRESTSPRWSASESHGSTSGNKTCLMPIVCETDELAVESRLSYSS